MSRDNVLLDVLQEYADGLELPPAGSSGRGPHTDPEVLKDPDFLKFLDIGPTRWDASRRVASVAVVQLREIMEKIDFSARAQTRAPTWLLSDTHLREVIANMMARRPVQQDPHLAPDKLRAVIKFLLMARKKRMLQQPGFDGSLCTSSFVARISTCLISLKLAEQRGYLVPDMDDRYSWLKFAFSDTQAEIGRLDYDGRWPGLAEGPERLEF